MALRPGEAAVLFIRRDDKDPSKYFVAVRRSDPSSFDDYSQDFIIGPFQIPVIEFKAPPDFEDALNQAMAKLREQV